MSRDLQSYHQRSRFQPSTFPESSFRNAGGYFYLQRVKLRLPAQSTNIEAQPIISDIRVRGRSSPAPSFAAESDTLKELVCVIRQLLDDVFVLVRVSKIIYESSSPIHLREARVIIVDEVCQHQESSLR